MKCREAQELMGAYLYGDLASEEMHELRIHAQDCALCREDLATRGRVISSLSDAAPVLSDTDRQRIAWSVKGAVRRKQARPRPLALRLAPALMLATAVLVAGFFAGRLATRSPRQHGRPGTPNPPQAQIEVKETTNTAAKPAKVPDQVMDAILNIVQQGTVLPGTSRQTEPGSRHHGGRGTVTPPDTGVKLQPEPTSILDQQQPAAAHTPDAAQKDSDAGSKKSDVGAEKKLPRVTDPKNAETTPSDSQ